MSQFGIGFDFMVSDVPVVVVLGFVIILGVIVARVIKGGIQWNENNNSPILTVDAKVVAKRMAVSRHHHNHGDMSIHNSSSSTTYFATFEVDSGDRMELCIPDKEYGMLVEGDTGRLTFKGTRYQGYDRDK